MQIIRCKQVRTVNRVLRLGLRNFFLILMKDFVDPAFYSVSCTEKVVQLVAPTKF